MKRNEFSLEELRPDATEWLTKLHQTMLVKEYGKGSVRNYCLEMKLLFKYKAVTDYLLENHTKRLTGVANSLLTGVAEHRTSRKPPV